jgi:hypothetical protein
LSLGLPFCFYFPHNAHGNKNTVDLIHALLLGFSGAGALINAEA